MQFRHPEILYALLFLIIPILVHLFQLRRFKEELFTNVAFLKKIEIQTRKSSSIKKWLLLLTRMAAIAMLVIAFAQPFLSNSDSFSRAKETVIYLDNSFSMQAKGASGPLLRAATQDLLSSVNKDEKITILTNNQRFKQTTIDNVRNELIKLPYTYSQLSEEAITLKALKEFSTDVEADKRVIYISDFQGEAIKNSNHGQVSKHYVQLTPNISNNISIDSVFISARKVGNLELTVRLSSQEAQESNTSVSIYNSEQLLAKGTASFKDGLETELLFTLDNSEEIEGKIVIEDPFLAFDNTLFFSINKDLPVKVLVVNGVSSQYLKRIFTEPEFQYTATTISQLDYSSIPDYNYIVINEVKELSNSLIDALSAFAKAGGTTTILLNNQGDIINYTQAIQRLANMTVKPITTSSKLITTINYSHPIYKDVFENRIENFQYPSVSQSFELQGGDALLKFQDGHPFLVENNGFFVISGSITTQNSNFQNSPLIVPTFYNMSRQSLTLPQLYLTVGETNSYDIPTALQSEAILSLESAIDRNNTLIPLQQVRGNKVTITTSQEPSLAGIYEVKLSDSLIQQVSYNYPRKEGELRYANLKTSNVENSYSTIQSLFDQLEKENTVQYIWKWFIIFTLLFLLLEILILKFYK